MNLVTIAISIFVIMVALGIRYFLVNSTSKMMRAALGTDKLEQKRSFLGNQLKSIHSLASRDIILVNVTFDEVKSISLRTPQTTEALKEFLVSAKTCGRNKGIEQLRIEVCTKEGSFSYEAFVPTGNEEDIILKFRETGDYGGISIPGLKRWLDENILNKEDLSQ